MLARTRRDSPAGRDELHTVPGYVSRSMLASFVAGDGFTIRVPPMAGAGPGWGEVLGLAPLDAPEIHIDLSALRFVEPLFLLRLRAFMDWHAARGHEVVVEPPADRDVHMYMSRMGIADGLPDSCTCPTLPHRVRDRRDVLIPVRCLLNPDDSDSLDAELGDLLNAHFDGPLARLGEAFTMSASELTDNATTHGTSATGGYVAAQRYQRNRCVLAIADTGIGIPNHIRQVEPWLQDDGQAIARATEPAITAADDRDITPRGYGYQHIIDTMIDTAVPQGQLRVWSGSGRFELTVRNGHQRLKRGRSTVARTPGTWIRIELATR